MNRELGRREKGWKFHKEKNLLKNNVLTGFAYNLYFKRNLSTSHCSSLCQGKWWIDRAHIKMMTPIDAQLVPVEVELMEGKKDLNCIVITEIAINNIELTLKVLNFTFIYLLEKLRDLFLKNLVFGRL